MKKDSNKTPFELWYSYKPNVSYLKVFGSKCYILKESRKGKFDEGVFLGYLCKTKAYKSLNLSTQKIIESGHVKVDEFAKRTQEERKKEPENYRRFFFIDTFPDTSVNNKTSSIEPNTITKLQEVQTVSQGPES